MFSGIQELLLIVVILLAICFIPRIMGRYRSADSNRPLPASRRLHLSGGQRLALLASLLWPLAVAIYLEPWRTPIVPFLSYGLLPVLLGWSITWVMAGFMENRKK